MIDRTVRIYDRTSKRMLYPQEANTLGIVMGVDGMPMQVKKEGVIVKLVDCVPMYLTGLMATSGEPLWEGDIVECDVQHDLGGMLTATREIGVMVWHRDEGMWTLRLPKKSTERHQFKVNNTRIIGDIWQQPELVPKYEK